jgi:hypothetical protein
MTGIYAVFCRAHLGLWHAWLGLRVQGCGCTGAGVGHRGVRRYMYTATHKNQENEAVNH